MNFEEEDNDPFWVPDEEIEVLEDIDVPESYDIDPVDKNLRFL